MRTASHRNADGQSMNDAYQCRYFQALSFENCWRVTNHFPQNCSVSSRQVVLHQMQASDKKALSASFQACSANRSRSPQNGKACTSMEFRTGQRCERIALAHLKRQGLYFNGIQNCYSCTVPVFYQCNRGTLLVMRIVVCSLQSKYFSMFRLPGGNLFKHVMNITQYACIRLTCIQAYHMILIEWQPEYAQQFIVYFGYKKIEDHALSFNFTKKIMCLKNPSKSTFVLLQFVTKASQKVRSEDFMTMWYMSSILRLHIEVLLA